MKSLSLAMLIASIPLLTSTTADAQVFAQSHGIELVLIPQPSPGEGYNAGIVQARAIDPSAKIVTFAALSFNNAHQVWSPGELQTPGGTAKGVPLATPVYSEEWIPFDSHLLIPPEMVIGGGGMEYVGISETNDGSSTASASLPTVTDDNIPALSGYGNIAMDQLTDAFAIFREFQHSTIDLAYLVAPDDPAHRIDMSIALLGAGIGDPEFGVQQPPRGEIEYNPIKVPIGGLEVRVGSITGPTQLSTSFGTVEQNSRAEVDFLPIRVAPAPDDDASYSVELTGVTEISDEGGLFEFGGSLGTSIPAGTTRDIGPFAFNPSTLGDWTADYQLSFNDGTVIDATFAASVIAGMNNGGGNQGGGLFDNPNWYAGDGFSQPGGWTNGEVRHIDGATILAEFGGVQIVSVPQPSPGDGFRATRIEIWTIDPDDSVVTMAGLAITGTHQVWAGGGITPSGGTAQGEPTASAVYDESWIDFDSHLLISPDEIGGGAGGGYSSIGETNDGSTTVDETLPAVLGGAAPAESGIGPIAMDSATGAFFLDPESQANRVELAYVVIPSDSSAPVDLFLEVLGDGDVHAAFGFNGNEPVRIFAGVPEPCAAWLAWLGMLALPFLRRNSRP